MVGAEVVEFVRSIPGYPVEDAVDIPASVVDEVWDVLLSSTTDENAFVVVGVVRRLEAEGDVGGLEVEGDGDGINAVETLVVVEA